jgi:hypothetical protein
MIERKKLNKCGQRELEEEKFNGVSRVELHNYIYDEECKLIEKWTDGVHFDHKVTVEFGVATSWDDDPGDVILLLYLECYRWETDEELELRRKAEEGKKRLQLQRKEKRDIRTEIKERDQLAKLKAKYEGETYQYNQREEG